MEKVPKRLKKQLIIGGIYLGIFLLIFGISSGFVWKKLAGKEKREFAPLKVVFLKFFPNQKNWGSLLLKVKNPNSEYGLLSFSYKVKFLDQNQNLLKEISGKDFIYPLEAKFISFPKIEIDTSKVKEVEVSFFDLKWKKTSYRDSQLLVRQVHSGLAQKPEVGYFWVDGIVKNNSPFPLRKVKIVVLLKNRKGEEIGVGESWVYDLLLEEERYFKVVFSKEAIEKIEKEIDPQKIEVFAYTNLMKF